MELPTILKFTKDHEWIRVEGNTAYIGITDYAQGELGDVVFLDIDSSLSEIKKVSDIYGPFTGKVLEINPKLADNPELINSDPYGEGWMIKAEVSDNSELSDLLDSSAYKELIGQ